MSLIELKLFDSLSLFLSKTFELNGFTQLVQQIADSKKTDHATIIAQIASTSGPSLAHVTVEN